MENDDAEDVELPCYFSVKVHRLMCLELKNFVDRILQIYPAIESARPRCTSGVQALCSLVVTIDRAKLLIQRCTDSSKLYLAITGDKILLRCKSIQNSLDLCLGQIQNMVPILLAAKISGIIEDLKGAKFDLESSDEEAGKVVLALIRNDKPASDCIKNSELEALQLAALSLKITSPFAVLVEKRSIKRQLDKVSQINPKKEMILKYLLKLLMKYGELIGQDHTKNNLSIQKEPKRQSTYPESFVDWHETQADGTPKPPNEFECPISMRLMHDPVIIESGKTFERVWIEKWFSEGHETCPVTNIRLENLSLTPNFAMKRLISKWCSQHKIIISDPCRESNFAPVSSPKSSSPKSIASFGSSMNDLHLQVSSMSLRSTDTNYGSHLIDADENIGLSARLPQLKEVCTNDSSKSGCSAGLACLAKLASLPWNSQCKTVQDVKEQLNKNEQASDCMFSDVYMKSLLKFLKKAHDLCDVSAQKDSAEVILAILSEDRIEMPTFDGDSIYMLASFLDSKISGKALEIMELLSPHQFYKSEIIASGVLPSILKILDTQITEFHELAVKILRNVSCNGDIVYHIVYLDFIPNLVPFLCDCSLSGYCLNVLKNLCRIEEGRNAIAETDSCINSMAKLLESGTELEQESTIEVLSLCYEELECCQLVKAGSIIQSLFRISVNGTSRGKAIAMELLQLLGHVVVSDCFSSGVNFDLAVDISSGSRNLNKGEKSSSMFGYLGRKISRFFQ